MNYDQTRRNNERVQTYLNHLYDMDYRERPVPIREFIRNDRFIGRSTGNGKLIYGVWHKVLDEIFEDDRVLLIVFTGAIGTGKSTIAIISLAYVMYRILCLSKDPWRFYEMAEAQRVAISFFNLTKSLGDSQGFGRLQTYFFNSPWFRERAVTINEGKNKVMNFDYLQYVLSSPYAQGFGIQGEHVIGGIMDEVDTPTVSIGQKKRVLSAYESTYRRFESRFVKDGRALGRLFIVASKQDEMSFIDTFVAEKKALGKAKIIDIPLWQAKPRGYYSGVTFKMAVPTDAYHTPKILEDGDDGVESVKEGYDILDIPVEHKSDFYDDPVGALRDIAGRTIVGTRRYKLLKSERFVIDCFDAKKEDPVKRQTIEMGLQDTDELIWFLDVEKIRIPPKVPRCIHMDYGVTGDALGLAMSCVAEWTERDVEQPDGTYIKDRVPVVETDFVMRLKARPGDSIPTFKVRKFILDLRSLGFQIHKFTADLKLASEDTFQMLTKAGIECDYLSVDRTDRPYVNWRNLVYEKRWRMHQHDYVLFEAKHLEYDQERGKIDHPQKVNEIEFLKEGGTKEIVMEGSKDLTDAIVGSIESCLAGALKPMDVVGMKQMISRVTSGLNQSERPIIPMKDSDGKEIIAIKTGPKSGDMQKLKGIFKRL